MNITNLKLGLVPKTTLFKEEADAIVAVVKDVISKSKISVKNGTFLLYGVKNGEREPQRLISFDFGRGPAKKFSIFEKDSRCLAEEILELEVRKDHSESYSGISYYFDSPPFLQLRTTYGRFICAFYAGEGLYSGMTYVYSAVAKALALLCENDEVLQKSCGDVFIREIDDEPRILELEDYVEDLFLKSKLPELAAWQKWHITAATDGRLAPYFT